MGGFTMEGHYIIKFSALGLWGSRRSRAGAKSGDRYRRCSDKMEKAPEGCWACGLYQRRKESSCSHSQASAGFYPAMAATTATPQA